ncbi:MAG: CDP-alcohol phosphatidyltransferase family protein [Spirochaetes bacterium]|nr:CDP-alcohol phosphatidyltransferase family protein [Spirochaetota bacterium]
MHPTTVIFHSPAKGSLNVKICGLYVLERNIILMYRAGVRQIFLNLNDEDVSFYRSHIKKHLRKIALSIKETLPPSVKLFNSFVISANCLLQEHHLVQVDQYFTRDKNALVPKNTNGMFEIAHPDDIIRAEKILIQTIRNNTPGFIARNINKAISLPISRMLSKTRIHPNILTVVNMLIGFSSAIFISYNTHLCIALGGLFFQLASIFDGVDGEVAKLTLKVSRLGGWLDTISDNGSLILFLMASSYLFFLNSSSALLPIIIIALLFIGLILMLSAMISFLRKHTKSGSLVTYDKEFLQKLPDSDKLVFIIHKLKYYTKKEFFSLAFFIICLTGKIHIIIPIAAIALDSAAIMLILINRRYRNYRFSHS